ncbi:hypothetical protein J4E06_06790 [Muricauda sp. NFXS6]|uniref:hypothetical protein n=1 Tax=Allomuricauda sp. NFXS6 TaxID=2819094 RepID=UPI0032DE5DE3
MKDQRSKTTGTAKACCEGSNAQNATLNDVCCTQPEDGSPCCDPRASKEDNVVKTGCC